MSFFIRSFGSTPTGMFMIWLSGLQVSTSEVVDGIAKVADTTGTGLATIESGATSSSYNFIDPTSSLVPNRFFLVQLDKIDPEIFGIVTQRLGRMYWLYVDSSSTDYPLRYWNGNFPPKGLHPTKFKVTNVPSQPSRRYLFLPFYNKYLTVDLTTFTLTTTPSSPGSEFEFISNTAVGPVIPVAPATAPLANQKYHILTRYGKALQSSLTSPNLFQITFSFDAPQQFFFRAVSTPNASQPTAPFTYNMFIAHEPTNMLTFDGNGTVGLRTTPGPWESLIIQAEMANYCGRFTISSQGSNLRLRANADGSVSLVQTTVASTQDDYFTFLPTSNPTIL